jgi:hypothetical protein
MTELNTLSLSLILSLSLVACGGGGDSTVTTPTSVLPTITVPIPSSSYLAGSAELGGYTVLQQARVLCGFRELRQDTRLDAASRAHAIYQVNKSFPSTTPVLSHYERDDSKLPALVPDVTNPDYTGEFPWDRTSFTGYGTQVAEILMGIRWDYVNAPTFPTMEQRGTESMRSLLNTVYHLAGAMYNGADVGFGVHIDTKMIPNTTTWREEYRFGSLNGYQTSTLKIGAGNLVTYPCQGSSNIPSAFVPASENPNPFPEMTLSTQKVGPPIYLKVDLGQAFKVTYGNVSQNGVSVPITVLTNANDPNIDPSDGKPYIGTNEAFVIPTVALIPYTIYTVSLAGTINGVSFSRSFAMSTGM